MPVTRSPSGAIDMREAPGTFRVRTIVPVGEYSLTPSLR